jgi:hypothetical protein
MKLAMAGYVALLAALVVVGCAGPKHTLRGNADFWGGVAKHYGEKGK